MTKTLLAAAVLLSLGVGAAQAAEEYVTGYAAGVVSATTSYAASPILQPNASIAAPQAENSLPLGFQGGTSLGSAGYGTVLGQ